MVILFSKKKDYVRVHGTKETVTSTKQRTGRKNRN
jgi:hypothetical protein